MRLRADEVERRNSEGELLLKKCSFGSLCSDNERKLEVRLRQTAEFDPKKSFYPPLPAQ